VASNQVRIAGALDLLTRGLAPFVEQRLKKVYGDAWRRNATGSFRDDRSRGDANTVDWDAHSVLTVMWDQWNAVFRTELGHTERSLVSELREFRNRWAHQAEFDFDDTYRVLDSGCWQPQKRRRSTTSTASNANCWRPTSPNRSIPNSSATPSTATNGGSSGSTPSVSCS
jgi:hypothetical protein